MASERKNQPLTKSLQSIKTMAGLVDGRRTRTTAGALLEWSALANERERLGQELKRWQHRQLEIETRLAEIAAKEQRLQTYIKNPTVPLNAKPLAVADAPRGRVAARELRY